MYPTVQHLSTQDSQLTIPARLATNKLFSLAEYRNARRIGVYLSMPSGELSTTGIVQDALTHGKEVYIPYIYTVEPPALHQKTSVMDMLVLESLEEFESLESDKWGIPSLKRDQVLRKKNCFGGRGLTFPAESQLTHEGEQGLDLIVMPGMAFDHALRRLGHGKGYYDHFLTRYSAKETTATPQMPFLGKKPGTVEYQTKNETRQILTPSQWPSRSTSKCFLRPKNSPCPITTGQSIPSSLAMEGFWSANADTTIPSV